MSAIDSSCQDQTVSGADLDDRVWSAAAATATTHGTKPLRGSGVCGEVAQLR
jgi:hypothetical protein